MLPFAAFANFTFFSISGLKQSLPSQPLLGGGALLQGALANIPACTSL